MRIILEKLIIYENIIVFDIIEEIFVVIKDDIKIKVNKIIVVIYYLFLNILGYYFMRMY